MARREFPTVLELVGHTPIVRLERLSRDVPGRAPREARVPQPGRLGQGPHRARDGRGRGAGRAAAARRHDRRADLGQHRRRPRDGSGPARLPLHLRDAGQDEPGEDLDAARLRGRGRHHPDRGRPALAGELLRGLGRLAEEIPGGFKPDQYSNPANPDAHYETTGPELWEQTDGGDIDAIVISVGTGGTITGVGALLQGARLRARASSRSIPRAPSSPPTPSIRKGRIWSRASARSAGPTRSTHRSSTNGCASRIATRS